MLQGVSNAGLSTQLVVVVNGGRLRTVGDRKRSRPRGTCIRGHEVGHAAGCQALGGVVVAIDDDVLAIGSSRARFDQVPFPVIETAPRHRRRAVQPLGLIDLRTWSLGSTA